MSSYYLYFTHEKADVVSLRWMSYLVKETKRTSTILLFGKITAVYGQSHGSPERGAMNEQLVRKRRLEKAA